MVVTLGGSACEVLLHLTSDIVWVSPPTSTTVPNQDKLLDGVVEIECPSERMIHGIQVQLRATQIIGYPPESSPLNTKDRGNLKWEEHVVLDRTLLYHSTDKESAAASRPQFVRNRSLKDRMRDMNISGESQGAGHSGSSIWLDKGLYDFEFHFIIPAFAAPYERCRYGRTRYLLTATALGAGRGGSNVVAQREVFVVQHHASDCGALPVEMHFHDMHEALGLISVGLTSAWITVGGIAKLAVVHPNPPPNVNVHMIRVFIEQKYELYNHRTSSMMQVPSDKLRVWEIGALPRVNSGAAAVTSPALWAQGVLSAAGVLPDRRLGNAAMQAYPVVEPLDESLQVDQRPLSKVPCPGRHGYRIRNVVRLPDDNRLRPTTARGTRSDIRISHEMGVEVLFSRTDVIDQRQDSDLYGQPKVQVFSVAKPVVIPSCAFTYDSIHLPPYTQESPAVSAPASPSNARQRSEPFTPLTTLTQSAARTPPSAGSSHTLSTEPDFNRLVHSLTNSLTSSRHRSSNSSRSASRDTSPTRFGFRSKPSSRASSRPSSPPIPDESGTSTPVVAVHRPNDTNRRSRSSILLSSDRSAPRNLIAGSPWAVSNLPPRSGESHAMCNCGETLDKLIEAEERIMEGAPTAPGAWISTATRNAPLPPWTLSSRPTSPTQEWLASYVQQTSQPQTPGQRTNSLSVDENLAKEIESRISRDSSYE
ncbi:hypothetical protein MPSI1_000932 [Malassezia psittaci]|uniref:Arrestin-like N-terminal domain-containing protein n=1 Tax=Malassezia psittaci TaxID=1821823 RepID=A0AAF0F7K3_9BASI|nr:hypothetical protein MPSI1_000932 [Malassezia psittaci]